MLQTNTLQKLEISTFPLNDIQLIEASAGTGKTYTIAALYLRLVIEKGEKPENILVVTFTKAATEELKGRIQAFLRISLNAIKQNNYSEIPFLEEVVKNTATSTDILIKRVERALLSIDEALISTIHGFAQKILQQYSFECGITADLELIEDDTPYIRTTVEDFWRTHISNLDEDKLIFFLELWPSPDEIINWVKSFLHTDSFKYIPEQIVSKWKDSDWSSIESSLLTDITKNKQELKQTWGNSNIGSTIISYFEDGLFNSYFYDYPEKERSPKTKIDAELINDAISEFEQYLDSENEYDLYLPEYHSLFLKRSLLKMIAKKNHKKVDIDDIEFFHQFESLFNKIKGFKTTIRAFLQWQIINYCKTRLNEIKENKQQLGFNDLLFKLRDALRNTNSGNKLADTIRNRFKFALIDEFQDTDPVQYEIFNRIYSGNYNKSTAPEKVSEESTSEEKHSEEKKSGSLIMIGDPKQSIYNFRGADIFAYLSAASSSKDIFTLDINRRSCTKIVDAINRLFGCNNPFVYKDIQYHSIASESQSNKIPLTVNNISLPGVMINHAINKDAEGNNHTKLKENKLVKDILDLLEKGQKGIAKIGDKSLKAKDIAILARTNNQAKNIQLQLSQAGIKTAFNGPDSVFSSEEADIVELLLHAVSNPNKDNYIKTVLASPLFKNNCNDFIRYSNPETPQIWETVITRFKNYKDIWLSKGFMAMFYSLLHNEGIVKRALPSIDGERVLTNLLHLGEIIHSASLKHPEIDSLINWFHEQREGINSEDHDSQIRLESDEELIKIITIHKSKGLEYPVVFIPDAEKIGLDSKNPFSLPKEFNEPFLFHNTQNELCLELGINDPAENQVLAYKERLAESIRLIYVAITRAKYSCYLYTSSYSTKGSGLRWLACNHLYNDKMPYELPSSGKKDTFKDDLNALAEMSSGSIEFNEITGLEEIGYLKTKNDPKQKLSARTLKRRIEKHFKLSSYTALSHSVSHIENPLGETYITQQNLSDTDTNNNYNNNQEDEFPKGIKTGLFFHQILEQIDFTKSIDDPVRKLIENKLIKFGLSTDLIDKAIEIIENTLNKELLIPSSESNSPNSSKAETVSLRKINTDNLVKEMEFYFPISKVTSQQFNELFINNAHINNSLTNKKYTRENRPLNFGRLEGYMRGYIDLIFQDNNKFYLVDYKSTYLENYSQENLFADIQKHDYDLQYLIYTIALHRFLQLKVPNYSYEEHFGGVFYLYLRGIESSTDSTDGVYYDKPDIDFIQSLDGFLRGLTSEGVI